MAKLKIGQVTLAPTARKIEKPVEMPTVPEQKSEAADIMGMVEKAISMLPKPGAPKEIDLSPLEERVEDLAKQVMADMMVIDAQFEDFQVQLDELKHMEVPTIAMPEVKQVTHIRDVSDDVKREMQAMFEKQAMNHRLDLNGLNKKLKTQKVINLVLSGAILLTLLLHLA